MKWLGSAGLAVVLLGCGSDDGGGGSPASGGVSSGGASSGGASSGGASSGGASGAGGSSAGGASGSSGAGGSSAGGAGGSGAGGTGGSSGAGPGLAAKYPGDVGIDKDPDVVWVENFEEGTVSALLTRYESKQGIANIALDSSVPAASSGKASGKLTASGSGPNAVDFYKKLSPGYDELFVRYYAKYQAGVKWHHTGVWVGGYNPASNWPSPQAGLKPDGDDRFHVSLEPMTSGATPRMDFYNYWMKMHSWMDQPSGNTAYYGNSVIHDPALTAKDQWQCFELHIKLNPSASSGAGAELGVWVNDQSVLQFTDKAPLGYWVKDKFCPEKATGTECTQYKPASPTLVPLDLQWRSTTDLKLNAFWPQNYITEGGAGSVWYDDMVIAKSRVGCMK